MSRVLLVGGGATSAITASIMMETLPSICLTVWDKARGAGGRMSTSRSASDPGSTVDLGAQYISATPQYFSRHQDIYKSLLDHSVLVPLNVTQIEGMRQERLGEGEETQHYMVPEGMSSLVKHFFKKSGAEINFQQRVTEINKAEDRRWRVRTEGGLEDVFDAVVLTMPTPQILQLGGDVSTLLSQQPDVRLLLENVSYSTRFVLGLYYGEKLDLDGDWACKYVSDHPIIRFVSVDNIKRGNVDAATSILVHSTVEFGLDNMNKTHEEMKPQLLAALSEMFPRWPQPKEVKSLKWLYSQIHQGYPDRPGSVLINSSPTLVLGGDAFSESTFDGCVESALSISKTLENLLDPTPTPELSVLAGSL